MVALSKKKNVNSPVIPFPVDREGFREEIGKVLVKYDCLETKQNSVV
jgi:hypothetical protein